MMKKTAGINHHEASSPLPHLEILTICMYCGKIRASRRWRHLDSANIAVAGQSHGVCPPCYRQALSAMMKEVRMETA